MPPSTIPDMGGVGHIAAGLTFAAASASGMRQRTISVSKQTSLHTTPPPSPSAPTVPVYAFTQPKWYQAGGIVDQFDKAISLPILTCPSLGRLEYFLMLPGSAFGVPIFGMFFATFFITMLWDGFFSPEVATTGPTGVFWSGLVAMIVGVSFWMYCVWESTTPTCDLENQGISRLFQPLGRKVATFVNIFSPNIAIGIIYSFCAATPTITNTTTYLLENASSVIVDSATTDAVSPSAVAVGSFYVTSYISMNLCIEFLKTVSRRMRPVISLEAELKHVKRQLPQNQWIFKQGHAKGSSFPSSDVAGAALFATMLQYLATEPSTSVFAQFYGTIIIATSMFCRVYFHAHHVGDILAGATIGITAMYLMVHMVGPIETYTYSMCAKTQPFLYITWALVQKLKPKDAQSILNADNLFSKEVEAPTVHTGCADSAGQVPRKRTSALLQDDLI